MACQVCVNVSECVDGSGGAGVVDRLIFMGRMAVYTFYILLK